MNTTDLINLDATSTQQAIKDRKLTCKQVVSAYIDQIKKVNPYINALVEERFHVALKEAAEKDNHVEKNIRNKPLFGVPISIKESFHVKGMKTTGGLIQRKDIISKVDADVVKKLKEAGAIILGKTNTPALCFAQETENKLFGRTNNAWDITKTAGGSSGGEGSLLGIGGAAVGIGSDIGGSIRFPSHFNGVIGFKPGKYTTSMNGHYPSSLEQLQTRMLGLGPLGKSVQDMELIYQIISKVPYENKDLTDMTIDVYPSRSSFPLSTETKNILDSIYHLLSNTFQVDRKIPPQFESSAILWQKIMSINGAKEIRNHALNNHGNNLFSTYIKEQLTNQTIFHRYLLWALIGARFFQPTKKQIHELRSTIVHGDERISSYLNHRLLIFPVFHTGAKKHGSTYKEIFSINKTFIKYMPYIAYANVWGLPSLTIPVATDESGMPISIQIMSSNGNEDPIFQLGKFIEREFRGYVRSMRFDHT